jgi:hypothetical protein
MPLVPKHTNDNIIKSLTKWGRFMAETPQQLPGGFITRDKNNNNNIINFIMYQMKVNMNIETLTSRRAE